LSFTDCDITGFSIVELNQLEELNLHRIQIKNFSWFAKLNNLKRLNLHQCGFTLSLLPVSNIDKSKEFEKYISFDTAKSDLNI